MKGSRTYGRFLPKAVGPAAGAMAIAAIVWLAFRIGWPQPNSSEQQLVAAVGTDRTIEARLSGGFAYGPLRGAARGTEAPAVSADVRIAVARIEKEAEARRTPRNLRLLGIAYLVIGEVNRAIPPLEEATDQWKSDGRVLSDLAAARR